LVIVTAWIAVVLSQISEERRISAMCDSTNMDIIGIVPLLIIRRNRRRNFGSKLNTSTERSLD